MLIRQKCRVEAAHRLPKHDGKCKALHGHSYAIDVKLFFDPRTPLQGTGVILDFAVIKEIVAQFDHTYLNEHDRFTPKYQPPSAENFARLIMDLLYERLTEERTVCKRHKLSEFVSDITVEIREGLGKHSVTYSLEKLNERI